MEYGQFCPIAKATEIIGEKWTILIIRELLMGGSRFNELQRGLSLISPTILSKRLESLSQHGLIVKKEISGQKGYEYFPTESCKELLPVIRSLGDWGMRWARANLTSSVKSLADIWMGESTYKKAVNDGSLKVVGNKTLTRNITAWMSNSLFADLPPASKI